MRNVAKNTYRIRINRSSMELVREQVTPYMHSIFMYKLGQTIKDPLKTSLNAGTP